MIVIIAVAASLIALLCAFVVVFEVYDNLFNGGGLSGPGAFAFFLILGVFMGWVAYRLWPQILV